MNRSLALLLLGLAACGGDDGSDVSGDGGDVDASSGVDCTSATAMLDRAVCQANGFLGTLSSTQLATANPAFTDKASRTKWSNLPTGMVERGGIQLGTLTATSHAAALELMGTVLSDTTDLEGVRAADEYLKDNGGGNGYGADLYWIGVFGTPTATGEWSVMFGGHHMGYNITFAGGVGYPTPNHLGVEPKAAFTQDGTTYSPLVDEGNAMVALFGALSSTELTTAHLSGTFGDVLVGPVEYGTGSSAASKAKFPTGANRTGVLASSLTTAQQALVTAAIAQWVGDFDPAISDSLTTAYTSTAALADTYVAWAGTGSAPNVETNGTYFRIDGPRVWIEVACQGGVVVQGKSHYHTIYRDKEKDYGGTL